MNQITAIRKQLKLHLNWHGARLDCLALLLIALLRVRAVDLSQLSIAFMSSAKSDSSFKRLQRFFKDFDLNFHDIARFVVSLMDIPQPWVLSVDRTNWEFGICSFNFLVLGVVHEGIAFPLLWLTLDKKGNSSQAERIDLIEEFLAVFPAVQVDCITADREFVGKTWFEYLLNQRYIPFRIRIRYSEKLWDGRNNHNGKVVFAHLQPGQQQVLKRKRRIWGHWVYVSALRLQDNQLLLVVSHHKPRSAIADYGKRWGIETLFGCLKSRGFCLESTHFRDPERLSRMLGILAIALCWAFKTGEWIAERTPIVIKNHGRKIKSIFRVGLDHLRGIVLNIISRNDDFIKILDFLSCT